MSISTKIERSHILQAIQVVKDRDVPRRHRSRKYDVHHENGKYPPKYLIHLAHTFVDGKVWPTTSFSGGAEANNFLIGKGFKVFDKTGKEVGVEAVDENEELTFPEGRVVFRRHRARERDSRVAKIAKNRRLHETGRLSCDVCDFSFSDTYGSIGTGFIEAHHTIPVSRLGGIKKTKIEDIALVCSNCHRMLHWTRPWLSVGELRKIRLAHHS